MSNQDQQSVLNPNILIVEDDAINRKVLRILLKTALLLLFFLEHGIFRVSIQLAYVELYHMH